MSHHTDAAGVEVEEAIPNNAGIAVKEDPAGVQEGDNAYPRSEDESDDLVEQSSDDEFDGEFYNFNCCMIKVRIHVFV